MKLKEVIKSNRGSLFCEAMKELINKNLAIDLSKEDLEGVLNKDVTDKELTSSPPTDVEEAFFCKCL